MLAADTGQQDTVAADMKCVCKVCEENHTLNVVFRNPVIREDKKRAIVEELFAGEVCRETMAFLNFVVKKNRSINLKGIAETYLEMYRESRNVILSKLTTATPVDESVKTSVEKMISSYTGKEVELITGVKSDIIGGLRVEFNNMMYDGSVSSKIAKLRRDFNKNLYESEL